MNYDKFTEKTRECFAFAQQLAGKMQHQELVGLHLLAGLLNDSEGTACSILQASCSAVAESMPMAIRQDLRIWWVSAACSAASRPVFVRQIRLSASMVR